MKKQITTIVLGILMLTGVMAMYAGENMTFEMNTTNPVYTIVGNSSSLEGLNITFENGIVTISPALNYKPDNFTLLFFDNSTREVEKIIYRGRGSSTRTKYVERNVTVYVPEYINTTETIEVEKIIDRVEIIETGYNFRHILLSLAVGLIIALLIMLIERRILNQRSTK